MKSSQTIIFAIQSINEHSRILSLRSMMWFIVTQVLELFLWSTVIVNIAKILCLQTFHVFSMWSVMHKRTVPCTVIIGRAATVFSVHSRPRYRPGGANRGTRASVHDTVIQGLRAIIGVLRLTKFIFVLSDLMSWPETFGNLWLRSRLWESNPRRTISLCAAHLRAGALTS
jgi:hypothetical protein